jgi:hypothetical protein
MKNVFYLSLLIFLATFSSISSSANQKFMNNKSAIDDDEASFNGRKK